MGTLHEFATAFEAQKPIGVLLGSGGIADKIPELVIGKIRETKKIVYEKDPVKLVRKLISLIKKEKGRNNIL
jgi:serine/threonine protein phosphatase PrpC